MKAHAKRARKQKKSVSRRVPAGTCGRRESLAKSAKAAKEIFREEFFREGVQARKEAKPAKISEEGNSHGLNGRERTGTDFLREKGCGREERRIFGNGDSRERRRRRDISHGGAEDAESSGLTGRLRMERDREGRISGARRNSLPAARFALAGPLPLIKGDSCRLFSPAPGNIRAF